MNSLSDLRNLISTKFNKICIKLFNGWQLLTNKGTFELGPDGFSKDGVTYPSEKELHLDLGHLNHVDTRNRRADADKAHEPLPYEEEDISEEEYLRLSLSSIRTSGYAHQVGTPIPVGATTTSSDPVPAKPKRVRKAPAPAVKKAPVKKAATKKVAVKKAAPKKLTGVKRPVAKKAPVKKPATKKKAK